MFVCDKNGGDGDGDDEGKKEKEKEDNKGRFLKTDIKRSCCLLVCLIACLLVHRRSISHTNAATASAPNEYSNWNGSEDDIMKGQLKDN